MKSREFKKGNIKKEDNTLKRNKLVRFSPRIIAGIIYIVYFWNFHKSFTTTHKYFLPHTALIFDGCNNLQLSRYFNQIQ